jgi:DNA-binding transcriptional ArsR family regulator
MAVVGPLPPEVDIVPVAALLADGTRAAMLTALLDDRPLAAGELALAAGVSAATASAHLARLLAGGLVTVVAQGRHRYYRLASHEVADAIEALSHLSPAVPVRSLRQSQQAKALAEARTCYDHLAGRAGVALLDALLARGILVRQDGCEPANGSHPGRPANGAPLGRPADGGPLGRPANGGHPARPADGGQSRTDGGDPGRSVDGGQTRTDGSLARAVPAPQAHGGLPGISVTPQGDAALAAFGIKVCDLRGGRRKLAGQCLDWTERRPHLNGALGAALTSRLLDLGWIERGQRRRAVQVTATGRDGLAATFGCSLPG